MTTPRRAQCTPQLLFGLAIAGVGLLFTLDNLGILRARDFLRFWPVALIAIGASHILDARTPARVVAGLVWMFVGSVLLGNRLDLVPWSLWDFWPLLFVAAGGYIVWQAFTRDPARPPADQNAVVSGVAVLSGFERRITSGEFRGGELTAFMGGCELDLRGATIAGDQAVLSVFAMMGGIALKVPETWQIVVEVVPFMGGVEDKTRQIPQERAPKLILRGFVTMGGIELKN
jgi:hypothetical protein